MEHVDVRYKLMKKNLKFNKKKTNFTLKTKDRPDGFSSHNISNILLTNQSNILSINSNHLNLNCFQLYLLTTFHLKPFFSHSYQLFELHETMKKKKPFFLFIIEMKAYHSSFLIPFCKYILKNF